MNQSQKLLDDEQPFPNPVMERLPTDDAEWKQFVMGIRKPMPVVNRPLVTRADGLLQAAIR
jgi:hypothetical protein